MIPYNISFVKTAMIFPKNARFFDELIFLLIEGRKKTQVAGSVLYKCETGLKQLEMQFVVSALVIVDFG